MTKKNYYLSKEVYKPSDNYSILLTEALETT